jgi:hypothetical protein
MTAITGDIAAKVGPYTSSVTDALDLGLVVPVEVLAAIQLIRVRPEGSVLTLVMLIVTSVSASCSWRKVLRS